MKHLFILLSSIVVLFTSCSDETVTPSGKDNLAIRFFPTSVKSIKLSDGIDFELVPLDSLGNDSTIKSFLSKYTYKPDTSIAVVKTSDNVQGAVAFNLYNGILNISRRRDMNIEWGSTPVKITIGVPMYIQNIDLSNHCNGTCSYYNVFRTNYVKFILADHSSLSAPLKNDKGEIWVELSDSSRLSLNGKISDVRLLSDTRSTYNAYDLSSTNLILQSFRGESKAFVTVSSKIYAVDATGNSILYYKGDAVVNPNSNFNNGAVCIKVDE